MSKKKTLDVATVNDLLNKSGYICDNSLASQVFLSLHVSPVGGSFLYGPAGCGKSELPQKLGEVLRLPIVFYQCFPGTREEDLFMKVLPDDTAPTGIGIFPGPLTEAATLSKEKRVILILDEWDKTLPKADAFLLDFLQSGRISYGKIKEKAVLKNLLVFITMNDERDLSEPLLRRLPMIEFGTLSPDLVKTALEITHPKHPYIDNTISLYKKCQMAKLAKPVTIQEMRQFLDAIVYSGSAANWNDLVFQFITKNVENHALLKTVEHKPLKDFKSTAQSITLDSTSFSSGEAKATGLLKKALEKASAADVPNMPKVSDELFTDFGKAYTAEEGNVDLTKSFGITNLSDKSFNEFVKVSDAPIAKQSSIGTLAAVLKGKFINLNAPIPLHDFLLYEPMFRSNHAVGELYFQDVNGIPGDMKVLQEAGLIIEKFTSKEILGKKGKVYVRWEKSSGLHVVVDLSDIVTFEGLFLEPLGADGVTPLMGSSGIFRNMEKEVFSRTFKTLQPAHYKNVGAVYRRNTANKFAIGNIVMLIDESIPVEIKDTPLEAIVGKHYTVMLYDDYAAYTPVDPDSERGPTVLLLAPGKKLPPDELIKAATKLVCLGTGTDIPIDVLSKHYNMAPGNSGLFPPLYGECQKSPGGMDKCVLHKKSFEDVIMIKKTLDDTNVKDKTKAITAFIDKAEAIGKGIISNGKPTKTRKSVVTSS